MEEMNRTTTIVWSYKVNSPDWQEVEWIVTHEEGDYWYWPELNTFKVYHRTDAYEVVVHTEQLVDDDFEDDYLLDVIENIASKLLPEETETKEIPF